MLNSTLRALCCAYKNNGFNKSVHPVQRTSIKPTGRSLEAAERPNSRQSTGFRQKHDCHGQPKKMAKIEMPEIPFTIGQ
jgi:hypothetical protein